MSTLWSKGTQATDLVEDFTVGNDRILDMRLAKYDVQGSMAHIKMLESIGLLTSEELEILTAGLQQIMSEIEAGTFILEDDVEDIHSQVELLLTRRLGDIGKKIHSGRSRNDQVLVDVKLFLKDETLKLREEVLALFQTLQSLSEKHKDTLLPGYTHGQVAMPSSFGLWFGAYAEAFADDMYMLRGAYNVTNQNPLGSAAGYGSSFPLDRQMTTDLLDFGDLDCSISYGRYRTYPQQVRCRLLHVYESELRIHQIPGRTHNRFQHHAAQEESRRMGNHARKMQHDHGKGERNLTPLQQYATRLPQRIPAPEGHPLPCPRAHAQMPDDGRLYAPAHHRKRRNS